MAAARRVWEKVGASVALATVVLLGSTSCRKERVQEPADAGHDGGIASTPAVAAPAAAAGPKAEPKSDRPVPERPTRYEAAPRIVAIGDVHGDLEATRKALRLAGAIGENDAWIGADLVLVQTGDQLDRGNDEPQILDLFERLEREAEKAGGAVHVLNGNHELMNVFGDFRYVTPEGFEDFADVDAPALGDAALAQLPPVARARAAAFAPGGPIARRLAHRNTVVIVGDTVFAHGGVLPEDARRLDELNRSVRALLWGVADDPGAVASSVMNPESVVWTRTFSDQNPEQDCELLEQTLRSLSVRRMVVGHTVQEEGITSACDGKVWRIDVGMAEHYGGEPRVLEIRGDEVSVLGPS